VKYAVEGYNNTRHSVTDVEPKNAFNGEAAEKMLRRIQDREASLIEKSIKSPEKFHKNQLVRVKQQYKSAFAKSNNPMWSAQQYRVKYVKRTFPQCSYKLETLDGIELPGTFPERFLN